MECTAERAAELLGLVHLPLRGILLFACLNFALYRLPIRRDRKRGRKCASTKDGKDTTERYYGKD
jgi:hypothetical protein